MVRLIKPFASGGVLVNFDRIPMVKTFQITLLKCLNKKTISTA